MPAWRNFTRIKKFKYPKRGDPGYASVNFVPRGSVRFYFRRDNPEEIEDGYGYSLTGELSGSVTQVDGLHGRSINGISYSRVPFTD